VADCPTTKYCANDPENRRGRPDSCYYDDECCSGGQFTGPCLVWDSCDQQNHVCVRTTQDGETIFCSAKDRFKYGNAPCAGGLLGAADEADGSICNNECIAGVCTSTSTSCP
jgi:hypothetical protein